MSAGRHSMLSPLPSTAAQWMRVGVYLGVLGPASFLAPAVGAQTPVYLTQWGSFGRGDGQFNGPGGVAVDAAGNVYVADRNQNRIQKFTNTGSYLTQWGSSFPYTDSGDGQFTFPAGIATDGDGNVYVADQGNHRIQKFTNEGTYLTQWGSLGSGDGQFNNPNGVAVDAAGNVYVADWFNYRIQKFTGMGTYLTQWGSAGTGNGQFVSPSGGLSTDAGGNVYVVDSYGRVQKFTSTGVYLTQWGSSFPYLGYGEGQFQSPAGVATHPDGIVYVADRGNHRMQEFTDEGDFVLQWGTNGQGDGQFNYPSGVAVDAAGNIYVVDTQNSRVQKFGPAPAPVAIAFDVTPNTLNLRSQGLWITGFLEPASPFLASDIDIASIRLNRTVAVDPVAPTALGDHDGNGILDLMVKFNREAVELTLAEGDHVPLKVTGTVGEHFFFGSDEIRVRHVPILAPVAGTHLTAGSATEVRWQTPPGVRAESAALLQSFDGGSTWSLIARGQPNTGSYDWVVPSVHVSQAKVAVVLTESADESGDLVDGVLGVSEEFSIDALVDVADGGAAQFALRGVTPNPTPSELRVSFSLRGSEQATLALFDVSGRRVEVKRVESMGPGWHTVTLGEGKRLSTGVYLIHLTQRGQSLTTRAMVVR